MPRLLAAAVCLALATAPAYGQTGANVLVIANEAVPASLAIGEYYVQRRDVPADQLLKIQTSTADQITRIVYEQTIARPISQWLARHAAQDRILFIVLTKGIPLRIAGTGGRQGTVASVDSELALLTAKWRGSPCRPTARCQIRCS